MKHLLLSLLLFVGLSFGSCEYYDTFYSSFIRSAIYCDVDDYSGELTLDLNGSAYTYYVSYSTWIGFKNASSKGRYFNQYIR